jgi:MFS family permease
VGGVLISGLSWRAIFLINVPLGLAALFLAQRHLPADRRDPAAARPGFDGPGTVLLCLTLAAYALAATLGRGHYGTLNLGLLVAAVAGLGLFVLVELKVASPLIRLGMLRDARLRAGLVTSLLVATVLMATLVVGPFYLSRGLGLEPAMVGAVLAIGPVVAALTGVPAGRVADRFGAQRLTLIGLAGIAAGCALLAALPAPLGILGYAGPIVVITAGYGVFQTANNTSVMQGARPDQRGVISGLLNLSRNLGSITGASVMGAVFALAARSEDLTTAGPGPVATGMRVTFAVGAGLIVAALAAALTSGPNRSQNL